MNLDYLFSDDFFPFILFGGLAAGFITGLLGAGGGLVLVPLFLYVLPMLGAQSDVVMHQAISTSLAVMVFSTSSAALKQYRSKLLILPVFIRWSPYILIGTILGSIVFPYISDHKLKIFFITYLVTVAIYMSFKNDIMNDVELEPKNISNAMNIISGIFVGVVSKLLGIGGATFTVPYYTYNNYNIKSAIALSSASSLLISISATLGELLSFHDIAGLAEGSKGYVNLACLALITPISMLAAHYGVVVNHRISPKIIKYLYIASLLIVSAQLSFDGN